MKRFKIMGKNGMEEIPRSCLVFEESRGPLPMKLANRVQLKALVIQARIRNIMNGGLIVVRFHDKTYLCRIEN